MNHKKKFPNKGNFVLIALKNFPERKIVFAEFLIQQSYLLSSLMILFSSINSKLQGDSTWWQCFVFKKISSLVCYFNVSWQSVMGIPVACAVKIASFVAEDVSTEMNFSWKSKLKVLKHTVVNTPDHC